MIDLSLHDHIIVTWLDAEQYSDWKKQSDIPKPQTTFKNAGWFIKQDEDYLYLAEAIGIYGNDDIALWVIPLGCIKDVKKISPG